MTTTHGGGTNNAENVTAGFVADLKSFIRSLSFVRRINSALSIISQDLLSITFTGGEVIPLRVTAEFVDEALEKEYLEDSVSNVMKSVRSLNAVLTFAAFQTIAAQLIGVLPDHYMVATMSVLFVIIFVVGWLFSYLSLTEWARCNAQRFVGINGAIISAMGVLWSVIGHMFLTEGSRFTQSEGDLLYCLHLPLVSFASQTVVAVLLGMEFRTYLRVASFQFILMTLCVIFEPIPGGPRMFVQVMFAIPTTGLLCVGLVRNLNRKNRHSFLLKRAVINENIKLNLELLEAHDRIAVYENPTAEETRAVQTLSSDTAIRFVSIRFEELELFEKIGSGAFGEVIRGSYRGSRVAVKRMPRNRIGFEGCMEALAKEICLLSMFKHPNIVTFIGASWNSISNICLVLEFMARGTLRDVTTDPQRDLSWVRPKFKFSLGVAHAMYYLHTRNPPVMHRDLKAENVLVSSHFDAKVGDFGSGRQVTNNEKTGELTQTGTPMYMAPEVFTGHGYSVKADVYSFGLLLVELTNEEKPFNELRHTLPLMTILTEAAMSGLRPYVSPKCTPPDVRQLISHCLAGDPNQRPSFKEVVQVLQNAEREMERIPVSSPLYEPYARSFLNADGSPPSSLMSNGSASSSSLKPREVPASVVRRASVVPLPVQDSCADPPPLVCPDPGRYLEFENDVNGLSSDGTVDTLKFSLKGGVRLTDGIALRSVPYDGSLDDTTNSHQIWSTDEDEGEGARYGMIATSSAQAPRIVVANDEQRDNVDRQGASLEMCQSVEYADLGEVQRVIKEAKEHIMRIDIVDDDYYYDECATATCGVKSVVATISC